MFPELDVDLNLHLDDEMPITHLRLAIWKRWMPGLTFILGLLAGFSSTKFYEDYPLDLSADCIQFKNTHVQLEIHMQQV